MKYIALLTLCFSLFTSCSSSVSLRKPNTIEQIVYISDKDTIVPKNITHFILLPNNKIAVATTQAVMILQDQKLLGIYPVENTNAFLLSDDTLFIASMRGLYTIILPSGELTRKVFPAREHYPKVSSLAIDQRKNVWVGTEGYGAFSVSGEAMRPCSVAPYISSVAVTADSSVWAGSNMGLFRIFKDGDIKRYYEEITANGIAIPDNIVEHLKVDNSGHLWIFMSQAVSVLTPDDYEKNHTVSGDGDVDPHTFAFLGSPSNHIKKFIQPKHKANMWWAISTEGLFVISDVDVEQLPEGIPDIVQAPKADLHQVSEFQDKQTKKIFPINLPTDLTFDDEDNLWISGSEGLWKIDRELLLRFGPKSKSQAADLK